MIGCNKMRMDRKIRNGSKQCLKLAGATSSYRTFSTLSFLAFLVLCGVFAPTVSVNALETTKANGLVKEAVYSSSKHNAHKRVDACQALLLSDRSAAPSLVPASSAVGRPQGSSRNSAGIGLVFGIRIALGSHVVIPANSRVQIGPELRFGSGSHSARALAIASYRRCKSEQFLKQTR